MADGRSPLPDPAQSGSSHPSEIHDEPRLESCGLAETNEGQMIDLGSSTVQSTIEPDSSVSDEGYAASTTTSYVTSLASDIRRGIEENGRVYAAYGIHKPWMPVDDMEVRDALVKERQTRAHN